MNANHDEFDARVRDMWERLEPARQLAADVSDIEFVSLTKRTSAEGNLCGARLYERGRFFRRKEVAEIIISNDRGDPNGLPPLPNLQGILSNFADWHPVLTGYSITIWGRGRLPRLTFEISDSPNWQENAAAVADEFRTELEHLKPLILEGRLSRDFPKEWTGEHWKDVFEREIVSPHKESIRMALLLTALGGPVVLLAGALLPPLITASIAVTLPMAGALIVYWMPGFPDRKLGNKTRWGGTICCLILVAIAWSWHFY